MKKMKKILLVVLCLMILPFQVGALESYKELDPNGDISFPLMIWDKGNNEFFIYNHTNYNLYYQYQLVNKETASKIETIKKEGEALTKDEINNKKNTCNTLREKYNADKTEENREAYNTCITEFNSLVDEYNKKLDEINEEMFALYPDYDDSKWIQSKDKKFNGTIEGLKEDTMAILWAKLVDNDTNAIVYDAVIVTLQGNKITTNEEDNKKTDSKGNVKTTSNQVKNPNTGDNNILVLTTGAVVSIIVIVICSKKMRKVK